jgi:hypothetical protein
MYVPMSLFVDLCAVVFVYLCADVFVDMCADLFVYVTVDLVYVSVDVSANGFVCICRFGFCLYRFEC